MSSRNLRLIVPTAIVWFAATVSAVTAQVFDLEDQPETGFNSGALTSLTLTRAGLTMTITRPGSPNRFDLYDVNDIGNPTFPSSYGVRSISPWFSNAGTAFVATFDRPVQSFSIDMGDFGGDPDNLFVQAFAGADAQGTPLDAAAATLPEGGSAFTQTTLTVAEAFPSIRSVRFMGGTESFQTPFGTFSIPNSVYYDNLVVVVPEPASLSLLAGAGLLALRRRK